MNSKVNLLDFCNFRTFSSKFSLKANVWAAKYNLATNGIKIFRVVVPKNLHYDSYKFESLIDKQTGEDSGFRIRDSCLWANFVRHQEDRLHESGNRIRFTMAECTGFQPQVSGWWEDRKAERYIFGHNSMFDCKGNKLRPVDCVFFPQLTFRKNTLPLLKPLR